MYANIVDSSFRRSNGMIQNHRVPLSSSISFLILFSILFHRFVISADSLTPRGVPLSRTPLYDSQKEFSCLDGSKLIPFAFVNDDYCDCLDGSDEPGTSACSRGSFFCLNAGHISLNIPSSRVDDQICDCCDGADEKKGVCSNTCDELGRAAREEAERQVRLAREGYAKRLEMSTAGKELRREKEEEKNKYEAERQKAEQLKEEKVKIKEVAEAPEKEALDRYHQIEEEKRKKHEEEEQRKNNGEAEELYNLIDSNGDEKITMDEIKSRQTFDKNKDGQVSDEEAMFFLDMNEEMSKEDFLKTGWTLAKPFFLMEQGMFLPPEVPAEEEQQTDTDPNDVPKFLDSATTDPPPVRDYEDDEMDDDLENAKFADDKADLSSLDADAEDSSAEIVGSEEEETKEPDQKYDEATRALISEADKARAEFREAESSVQEWEKKLEEVNEALNLDFGEDERYAAIYGQCFDYEDREYTYTLCPYKTANQRVKSGGGEVKLGKWGSWTGPEGNKYSTMLYDRGQSCWNGPTRSATVSITCGVENRLTGVSEPSRCEYLFDFISPAACQKPEPNSVHDEL